PGGGEPGRRADGRADAGVRQPGGLRSRRGLTLHRRHWTDGLKAAAPSSDETSIQPLFNAGATSWRRLHPPGGPVSHHKRARVRLSAAVLALAVVALLAMAGTAAARAPVFALQPVTSRPYYAF